MSVPSVGYIKTQSNPLCIECNRKANTTSKKKPKSKEGKQKLRRYDPVRADTF